ncbi:PorT family protein [Mucilaginibacter conchicola]|uniref:PorT family protein n=1 Tax=Mucilaginibacter conchicola TaxID=2303333 RepID=A0A372NNF9_9SPHI|nr:outer membrane beta-barrel protein [Mucilaginibacter conchicola]RFZ90486.1 PorT family protein [Mucilaginibacter conchicola]
MIKLRYLILIMLTCCSQKLLAQAWGGGADQNDLSFGFLFSYVQSSYDIVKKPDWQIPFRDPQTGNAVSSYGKSISSPSAPGFAVGFITRYRLTEHLEARITPSLLFADRKVTYTYDIPEEAVTKPVQTTTVDFPLQLKLKSDRIANARVYLIGGLKYSQSIGSKKDPGNNIAPTERLLKNVKGYSSYEVGAGFDIYFEYFKLSPELKFSNSFTNMLVKDNTPYASPLSRLGLRTLMLSLIFE